MANKIIIKSDELSAKLAVLGKVVGSNSMPILDNILIERMDEYTMRLTASNGETEIYTDMAYRGSIDAPCAIDYKWLKNICASCNGASTITLEYNVDLAFISVSTMDAVINGDIEVNTSAYPKLEGITADAWKFDLGLQEFNRCAKSISFARCYDATKPILCGLYFEALSKHEYRMACTDGRKLAVNSVVTRNEIDERAKLTLSYESITLLSSISTSNVAHITCTDSAVCAEVGDYTIQFKAIEGPYPNVMRVFPDLENVASAKFSRVALISAIKRAINFGNKYSGLTCVSLHKGYAEVIGDDADSSVEVLTSVACEYAGEDSKVGVCGTMAIAELEHLSGDAVCVYVVGSSSPMVIQGAEDTLRMLLMPMTIDEVATPLERALLAKQGKAKAEEPTDAEEDAEEGEQSEEAVEDAELPTDDEEDEDADDDEEDDWLSSEDDDNM